MEDSSGTDTWTRLVCSDELSFCIAGAGSRKITKVTKSRSDQALVIPGNERSLHFAGRIDAPGETGNPRLLLLSASGRDRGRNGGVAAGEQGGDGEEKNRQHPGTDDGGGVVRHHAAGLDADLGDGD